MSSLKRNKLPNTHKSVTHKFRVGGTKGYLTVGLYDDGRPGEIFITGAKEGSTLSGFMDSFAIAVSLGLQYGVPLRELVNKFKDVHFEPAGFTGGAEVKNAKSIVDYIFQWLELKFKDWDDEDAEPAAALKP